ncbi:MAG: dTMP kinase [Acetobacteraceae bacterium]|nr:dTMP kinase [Acetobacteraceae bacterium]
MSGFFVTLEGGEGGGKSTQALALSAALAARGIPALRTREPGGAPGAEALRHLLLARGWDPVAELALHFAARREHWARTIEPALAAGFCVICDRFLDSTWAYQVAGQGAPAAAFEQLRHATLGDRLPDLTLLLDLPEDAGLARARDANRYEALGAAFHAEVRAAFRARAAAEPGRFVTLDATRPREAVTAAALAVIRARLPAR